MHRRTKATSIPKKVKDRVYERDGGKCIVCHDYPANPTCHIVSRAHSGLGIETNIVCLCNSCHFFYDQGDRETHEMIDKKIVGYMKSVYGETWRKEDQVYKKWG